MSPIDFRMATTYGVPDGSTLADWPISYEELEPYYDRAEWALGVAGEPGHAHAGYRSRGYPLPPVPLGTTGHRLVSAGAIETARLLLMSQLGGPLVGTSLQGHTYVGAVGLFDEPVTDAAGPGPAIATCRFLHGNEGFVGGGMLADEFVKTPISFWHTALPPDVPRWGTAAKVAMREGYRSTAHVMGPIQELPNGAARVQLDHTVTDHLGLPVARLSGASHPDDHHAAKFLAERALEWMEASGAVKVWPGPSAKSHPRLSAGQHQAGTCRMGTDPATSVCNPTGTLHDCANVVLADGSVHVTNGGINPALTIMALAWRSAEALASRL
jgi:choline dehydrogenase-like flavoprotein